MDRACLVGLALTAACGRIGFDASGPNFDSGTDPLILVQEASLTAQAADADDHFGIPIAMTADGSLLVAGALFENSAATGIDGDATDNSLSNAGAAYVFTRAAMSWSQQSYVKASNTEASDLFGSGIALSADGSTLAIAAPIEDSSAAGIDGNQASNAATDSGAVYVFARSGQTWTQQAYVKASNPAAGDDFGISLALSADGSTLAVGSFAEDSNAVGVGGDQTNDLTFDSGAVYVFTRSGTTWSQQAYVKASNPDVRDGFGFTVALSGDGSTLAVGAPDEASSGLEADNSRPRSGAVYVFTRLGTAWSQTAYLKASTVDVDDRFGNTIALSTDGRTLAINAIHESSAATGVGGDESDNSIEGTGAVYVFVSAGTAWTQQAYVKGSSTGLFDSFGAAIALSADGAMMAIGAYQDDGVDDSVQNAGAAYVFTRSGSTWSQRAYVQASPPETGAQFGVATALSSDGATLAVGANISDNARGAVYVFR